MPAGVPVREIYWNIGAYNLMYVFFAIALVVFAYGCYQKYKFWQQLGNPDDSRKEPVGERIKLVLTYAFGHKRILSESFAGLMHSFIFYGFIILFIGTALVGLDKYLGINIVATDFFLYFKLLLDIAGLLAIVGVLMAAYRRYIKKPKGMDNKTDDGITLGLIFVVLVTGFFISGFRLAAEPVDWSAWTPVGLAFASVFSALISDTATLKSLHSFSWWFHMIMAFTFIAYIPYSKMLHMFTVTANQYMQNIENKAALSRIDFEDESIESFGVSQVEDFTWNDLFDTEACTRCGRCQDNCPAYLTEKPLSPKEVIQGIKTNFEEKAPTILAAKAAGETDEASQEAAAAADEDITPRELIGEAVDKEAISSCTNCGSCQEQCPAHIQHVPKIAEMRRYLVLDEGEISPEAQNALTNIERVSNPWGMGKATRADWTKGLDVPTLAENENPDILYWVGCAGAFDARNQKVSIAMVNVLKEAGVNFSIIGSDEMCCGDSARRLGNEYLYESLAEMNVEVLKELEIKKIVTHCPHCFNTLKNEYPQYGADFEVIHHSELVLELIESGKIKLENPLAETVTYHDSCFLGRWNDIYDQPRKIINAIPQTNYKEMERSHGKSFCCGAGGGRMWEEETIGQRINEVRADQALATGSSCIITGCPFCLTMMDDGVKARGKAEEVKMLDIAEIVDNAIKSDNKAKEDNEAS